jgi:MFS family permease
MPDGEFLNRSGINGKGLWSMDFTGIWTINFILTFIFYLLMVTIASYTMNQFNAPASTAGLVTGIFIIGTCTGRLIAGYLIGDKGGKKILYIGTLSFLITSVFYLISVNLPLLIFTRLINGFTLGIATTATGTIVAQIIPVSKRGEGIGYYSLSAILATAIGPFAGLLLSRYSGFTVIFIFDLILAAICFGLAFIINEPVQISNISFRNDKNLKISDFFEYRAVPVSIVAFIISFCFSGVLAFMSMYAQQNQLTEYASFFFLIYALTVLVSRPFSGRVLDLKGANKVMYPCLIIFAAGMILLSHAVTGFILLISGVIIGIGYGNAQSCAQAVSVKVVPAERLGLATSTYFILYDFGLGAGPYVLGYLIPITGLRGLYMTMVAVIFISIALYYYLHGRNAEPEQIKI